MHHAHVAAVNPFRYKPTLKSHFMATKPLVNKVKSSNKLATLDMEQWLKGVPLKSFDLKPLLFKEMIVKEDHFNEQLATLDLAGYKGAIVAIQCSVDTIIPTWAWLKPIPLLYEAGAKYVHIGESEQAKHAYIASTIHTTDWSPYQGKNVIIKGCSHEAISDDLYGVALQRVSSVASKVMIGEACSNVPLYKK